MTEPRRPGFRFAVDVALTVLGGSRHGPRAEPVATGSPAVPPTPTAQPVPLNWNIWDIERARRDRGESDEERDYLLMYLRNYAGPDGQLPLEFDDLVRESFGEVLGATTE